jgi:NIMA-interacting peptidyl-prolyl cis-trans isomerase 1
MSDTTSTANLVLDKPKSRDDWIKAPEWALIPKEELSIKLEQELDGKIIKTHDIAEHLKEHDTRPIFVIGRHADHGAALILSDPSISRQQAVVLLSDLGLVATDLQSARGTTYSNDGTTWQSLQPYRCTLLSDQMRLKFAQDKSEFVVRISGLGDKTNLGKRARVSTSDDQPNKRAKTTPSQIRCLHLLKKHRESRNPTNWRQEKITRTREEATALVENLRAEIEQRAANGESLVDVFKALALVESDCSSAKRGGDLGVFGRGQMQPSFESASFALSVLQLSGVVSSDSGVHIILRIE